MAGISSLGIGSGLDLSGLVQKLVAAEGQPATLRLDRREASHQAEISALGTFKSALSDFRAEQQKLMSIEAFEPVSATSGDPDLFSVSVSEGARVGNHSVEVRQLAQAQKLASKAFTSVTDVVGSGTLTFRFGTFDSGGNTFTVNANKLTQSVTIDPANTSLSGIRDAVNNVDIGVSASIVDDGTGQRLVFSSSDTGSENSLEITVSGDSDSNDTDDLGLSQLAFDPTAAGIGSGKNMSETVVAKDALMVVDGLMITRPDNTVSGVIEGVKLDLKSAEIGRVVSLTVEKEPGAVSEKVNQFVDGFNSMIGSLKELTRFNAETGEAGPLLGDATVRGVELQIRRQLSSSVTGLNGSVLSLSDIGIRTQSDGTLNLDTTVLQAAIDKDPEGVARLFVLSGSASDSLVRFTGSSDESIAGDYALNITQLASQGVYSGAAAAFPLTIDANNDTLEIKVDGVQSGTVSLTQKTYTTEAELVAELQSQINSDTALNQAEISVEVSFQSGQFAITSTGYGSSSSVEMTSVDTNSTATLGLSIGSGTAGVDVAGTIGGHQSLGSGQTLTGSGGAAGLTLEVLGGALGDRGTLSFAKGVSVELESLLGTYLESDSVVDSRIESLNDRISDIGDQRESLGRRLSALEERLRQQFTALDGLLSQLQSTSSFLTQQLSSLPGVLQQKSD